MREDAHSRADARGVGREVPPILAASATRGRRGSVPWKFDSQATTWFTLRQTWSRITCGRMGTSRHLVSWTRFVNETHSRSRNTVPTGQSARHDPASSSGACCLGGGGES
jgi:hypothetical protein